MQSMAETLGSRQADLARVMADRLDNVSARVGAGIESAAQTTGANLGKLNERLALIDAAHTKELAAKVNYAALTETEPGQETQDDQ